MLLGMLLAMCYHLHHHLVLRYGRARSETESITVKMQNSSDPHPARRMYPYRVDVTAGDTAHTPGDPARDASKTLTELETCIQAAHILNP